MFVPGQGPSGQVHDFNPGIFPSGLFWTQAIPNRSFRVWNHGREAVLKLKHLPMPDTFFFSNNVSVSGAVDVYLKWRAVGPRVKRGKGSEVPPDDWAAFEGHFADASCRGKIGGVETGFWFKTGPLTEEDFYASLGPQKNGVFLAPS